MGDFVMPSLGADMDEGTLTEWLVHPGDTVRRGDLVAVVDTEKSTIEVEVFEDGVVEQLLVPAGATVAVGTPLARLAPVGATPPAPPPEAAAPVPDPTSVPPAASVAAAPPNGRRPAGARVAASPLARHRAADLGIDLGSIAGTGPDGAVVAADLAGPPPAAPAPPRASVPQEPEAPAPAAAPVRPRPARNDAARLAIGRLMARSKREVPHYYLGTTIDLDRTTSWLAEANAHRPLVARIVPSALFLRATALAAREVPALNGSWDDGFRASATVDLGVAISLRGGGLVAPAIHDADRMTVAELMDALRDLVQRARAGALRSSDVAGASLTVTILGDQGADEVFGVIHPPQVALVGFGRVVDRPCAVGGLLGVHPTVRATLAADHRAADGHVGSRFLAAIDRHLRNPEEL